VTTNGPDGRRGRAVPPDYGTRARYKSHAAPCACSSCRARNAAYERQRRAAGPRIDPNYGREQTLF